MERYIDKLKKHSGEITRSHELPKVEVISDLVNPVITCCVTLGKELHAGHMLLITVADQARNSMESEFPIILINNNTGPRPAATLVGIAKKQGISVENAAEKLTNQHLAIDEIVTTYRSRSMDDNLLSEAVSLLETGNFDIFSKISRNTKKQLELSGYDVDIVPESTLLPLKVNTTKNVNPTWLGTGYTPFTNGKRLALLESGGKLTATGVLLTSVGAIAERLDAKSLLVVDSMPDVSDVVFTKTSITPGLGVEQLPGAGIGFRGEMASGTKGEAKTIDEVYSDFSTQRPERSLREAMLYLALTVPLSTPGVDVNNAAESFYDFYDNDSFMSVLIESSDDCIEFKGRIENTKRSLEEKISEVTITSSRQSEMLVRFLDRKSQSLYKSNSRKVLNTLKKLYMIKDRDEILLESKKLGYKDKGNPYIAGERGLAVRQNYFFNYLTNLLRMVESIQNLKQNEYQEIVRMIDFCQNRIGI